MKKLNRLLAVTGVTLALAFSGAKALAQGGGGGGGGMGGFDPAQMLQMMVDNMRDTLSVTNDEEWKIISPRLLKVVQLQMQERTAGMATMFRPRGGGPGGGGMRRLGAFGGEPNPAEEALQKALDGNAPIAEIKAALAKVRESRKQRLADRIKAQADLRDVLSLRQEAVLVIGGMLE